MYSVLDVCKYVIYYSNKKNYAISNLRLQKILYFIQAYFLRIKKKPCFKEPMEAWDFGPVVPEAYHHYKVFGASEIINYKDPCIDFAKSDKTIIEDVINLLSKYTTTQLVAMTHSQYPWKKNYVPYASNEISISDLQRFADGKR